MTINYIEKDGKKLFSFHRYDYQKFDTGEFIDGGFEYTRIGALDSQSGEIQDLIKDIRKHRVYQHESFPLEKWSNKLIKLYFRALVKKINMTPDQTGLFHIIGAEILYRQKHEKTRKTKIV